MKKFSLSVSEPCHENWDNMTATGKGRHCASCQKTVVDFTAMTDSQVAEFFKKSPANVCGRLYNSQLDREIIQPPRSLPLSKSLWQLSVPALLLLNSCDPDRKVTMGKTVVVKENTVKADVPMMGMVIQNPPPVDSAVVFMKPIVHQCGSMIIGDVEVSEYTADADTATVVAPVQEHLLDSNVIDSAIVVQHEPELANEAQLQPDNAPVIMGRIAVIPEKKQCEKKGEIPQKTVDIKEEPKAITLYPNPVTSGQLLTVLFHRKMTCLYQIAALSGQVISTGRLAAEKGQPIQIRIETLASGNYNLKIAELGTGKTFTEKFIVL